MDSRHVVSDGEMEKTMRNVLQGNEEKHYTKRAAMAACKERRSFKFSILRGGHF